MSNQPSPNKVSLAEYNQWLTDPTTQAFFNSLRADFNRLNLVTSLNSQSDSIAVRQAELRMLDQVLNPSRIKAAICLQPEGDKA